MDDIVVESHHLMHGVVHMHIQYELPIPYANQKHFQYRYRNLVKVPNEALKGIVV